MIKIENKVTYGWEAAIRGMRNPMNSWGKSDSQYCYNNVTECLHCADKLCRIYENANKFVIGDNDLKLMKQLVKAGTDHSKFMRMINVSMDITAPLYWWKEFDTYKVGTVRNSCSTMHKIHSKEFEVSDFSTDHLNLDSMEVLKKTIELLNYYRDQFIETKCKNAWWQMIQLLPSSYNQRATVQLNYAVFRNMYHARKNHKLDEWREFCEWIETLPYSELITMEKEKG